MKRFLCCLFAIMFMTVFAIAEDIDLSGFTFEELAALRDRIQLEMMTRDEWQEVTVPQGLWEVGVDIPAGTWTVKCADLGRRDYLLRECWIRWGIGKPETGTNWDYRNRKGDIEIYNPNSEDYRQGQVTSYDIELKEGYFVYIHPQYNKAVFTPYHGKPSLGFK